MSCDISMIRGPIHLRGRRSGSIIRGCMMKTSQRLRKPWTPRAQSLSLQAPQKRKCQAATPTKKASKATKDPKKETMPRKVRNNLKKQRTERSRKD